MNNHNEIDLEFTRTLLQGNRFCILDNVDPNPINFVGAAVLHMSVGGKVGCLLRYEPNKEAKLARLTIRTTNENVSNKLSTLIQTQLSSNKRI